HVAFVDIFHLHVRGGRLCPTRAVTARGTGFVTGSRGRFRRQWDEAAPLTEPVRPDLLQRLIDEIVEQGVAAAGWLEGGKNTHRLSPLKGRGTGGWLPDARGCRRAGWGGAGHENHGCGSEGESPLHTAWTTPFEARFPKSRP